MQHTADVADESSQGDWSQSSSPGNDPTVASEESAAGASAACAADNMPEAAHAGGLELAGAVLELPSEARFKQLASLHLLRATFQQEEEEGEVDRLSVERVLQSARRQNEAQRIRLAYMQQQIANQLRITEAQERRMGELLSHLQDVKKQSADLSMHEDSILQIIGDMNDVRAGNPRETHSFLEQAACLGTRVDTWSDANAMPSFFQICGMFLRGQARSCHLQFSLGPLAGRLFSLQDMSSCRPELVFQVVKTYEEAMKVQQRLAGSSHPEQAAAGTRRLGRLLEEMFCWLTALIVGQPPTYRTQHQWWKQQVPAASEIPLDLMRAAQDHAGLREEQLMGIQREWQHHCQAIASLEEVEGELRDTLRGEINQAASLLDSQGLYLPLMESAARLKANRAAHADRVLLFNSIVGLRLMEREQCAHMFAYVAPHQWRADTVLAAGLMQPTGNRRPSPMES